MAASHRALLVVPVVVCRRTGGAGRDWAYCLVAGRARPPAVDTAQSVRGRGGHRFTVYGLHHPGRRPVAPTVRRRPDGVEPATRNDRADERGCGTLRTRTVGADTFSVAAPSVAERGHADAARADAERSVYHWRAGVGTAGLSVGAGSCASALGL